MPYLRQIDRSRIYTNWGPLVDELTARLSRFLGVPDNTVVTASSGTAALVGGILATAGRARPGRNIAITQGLTFVATQSAIEQCGYRARIVDVDAASWSLDPAALLHSRDLEEVGVVVPVAAYGRPLAVKPWQDFAERTGIPVVIDAAACFDTLGRAPSEFIGGVPIALSFHATKVFSTGEGGCVICPTHDTAERVAQALNFGFSGDRNSRAASINGKLSEYSAAIGLASFDRWTDFTKRRHEALSFYANVFAQTTPHRLIYWPEISGIYILLHCGCNDVVGHFTHELDRWGIDYRFWYGRGLHLQEYTMRRGDPVRLPVTEDLSARLIGLPFVVDLDEQEKEQIEGFASRGFRQRGGIDQLGKPAGA